MTPTPATHPSVLAIDQGTSSTKAIVYGGDGTPRTRAVADVPQRTGPGGAVELDPWHVFESIRWAGTEALAGGGRVDVVALGNQGESVLAWDPDDGRPLSPAISWQDRRAAPLCARWQHAASLLRRETGAAPDPYFAAPKMRWLREHGAEGGVVTTLDVWLTWQLTGAFVTDTATASRTGALSLEEACWSPGALAVYGLAADYLPDIVSCDAVVGRTSAFGDDLPLGGLVVDQQASLLGHGCRQAGEAKCTVGTGAFLLALADAAAPARERTLTTSVAWVLGGRVSYCVDAQIFSAGAAVNWLVRLGLLGAAGDLDAAYDRATGDTVQFVPALAGWGAPRARPGATGSWTGLTAAAGSDDLVRAVVDGVAAAIVDAVAAIEEESGGALPALRMDGGLTRSRVLVQRIADLLQRPVAVCQDHDMTCRGLAELGRRALGDPAPELDPPTSADVHPVLAPAAAEHALARWRDALERTLA